MTEQEFQCRQCHTTFEGAGSSCSQNGAEVKCPNCGSTDIGGSSTQDGLLEYFRNVLRSGGG